jgi:hypothetical protein
MLRKGLSLLEPLPGHKKEQRVPDIRSQSLPWQRCSFGAQVAPQRCPILRSSTAILSQSLIVTAGRFFVVIFNIQTAQVDGFS